MQRWRNRCLEDGLEQPRRQTEDLLRRRLTHLRETRPLGDDPAWLRTLTGHTGWVNAVAYSPDGHYLASVSGRKIWVWDAESGKLLHTLEGHAESVRAVAYSPDGRYLASASDDKTVRVWDAESGKLLCTLEGTAGFLSCAFHPDGRHLAAGDGLGRIHWLEWVPGEG